MKEWYTVHTKPNAETQVAAALQQRGITTFLPQVRRKTPNHDYRQQPFFPCYLFINVDLAATGLSAVQWTPGLRRLVSFNDRPTPLAGEVIELIRHRAEALGVTGGLPGHAFKPGDTVRITAGPFKDMLAIFDSPNTPEERVQVLLTILGRASRYQLDASDLAKPPADTPGPAPVQSNRPRRTRGKGRRIANQ